MKPVLPCLAGLVTLALALACTSAPAQSGPLVYGLVDLNLASTTHVNPDGGSALRVNSGGMNTSRLGFSGSEALGGDLKALFQLEMGIAADTGVADTPLFKRQATVGVAGRFGSVLVGRAFTTVYDFVLPYDPMGYAPAYSWVPTGHGSGASKYGMSLAFDNMVKYAGKVGNLAFGASVGAGEAARSGDGAKAAVAASWSHAPFSVVAGWERVNDTLPAGGGTRPATRAWHLGAMLQRGPWRLQAGGRDYRHDGGAAPAIHARLLWAGANYQLTPALTATAAFYRQDVRDAVPNAGADPDATMLVTRLRYALSPRSDLYAVVARATTGAGAHVSLARDEVGYASGQRSLALGLQQRF